MARRPLRLTNAAKRDKTEALYAMLDAHARNGLRCPSLFGFASGLGISPETAHTLLKRLRAEKRITWRIAWSSDHGPVRIVTVMATRQSTQSPAAMKKGKTVVRPDQLDTAKTILRQSGAHVWDAAVDGGPKGFIRVDRELLKPADVIARAAALEARRQLVSA